MGGSKTVWLVCSLVLVSLPARAQDALGAWLDGRILEVKNLEGIILYAKMGADINGYDPETGQSILRQVVGGEIGTGPYVRGGAVGGIPAVDSIFIAGAVVLAIGDGGTQHS